MKILLQGETCTLIISSFQMSSYGKLNSLTCSSISDSKKHFNFLPKTAMTIYSSMSRSLKIGLIFFESIPSISSKSSKYPNSGSWSWSLGMVQISSLLAKNIYILKPISHSSYSLSENSYVYIWPKSAWMKRICSYISV